MRIVLSADREFFERCIEANDEVLKAAENEDHQAYMVAMVKKTVYGIALMNQLGTKEDLGPEWEIQLCNQSGPPN